MRVHRTVVLCFVNIHSLYNQIVLNFYFVSTTKLKFSLIMLASWIANCYYTETIVSCVCQNFNETII